MPLKMPLLRSALRLKGSPAPYGNAEQNSAVWEGPSKAKGHYAAKQSPKAEQAGRARWGLATGGGRWGAS